MTARVAILISGRGSNMRSLIEATRAPDYPARIALVVSNRADAAGLDTAAAAGIPTAVVEHRGFPDRAAFDEALARELDAHEIDLVCLAGFMRILTESFVEHWRGRMLNIHPSLLPAFKGLHPHAQALAAGVDRHGCTVHFVVPELDSGPTIVQATVPVLPGDDEASLAARVLAEEHRLYPVGLAMVARGEARLEGGTTVFAGKAAAG
ncbi:phosphoribosylglycinamide formyltransferase [uncultured Enterovirga sp.]|uniref:phosphoribosylglycinamide formyltransferase n=1 Tax=uncultured Enterovirga sp. TaxID=2026352 RepID=UPI0035CB4E13